MSPKPQCHQSLKAGAEVASIQRLAIGFFDGLHRGHLKVIEGAGPSITLEQTALLTFCPHPVAVLYPEKAPKLISGFPHKLRLLKREMIPNIIALPFDHDQAAMPAEEFLEQLLVFPDLKEISVGPNFRFGKGRKGDINLLALWCSEHGIQTSIAPAVLYGGDLISSSRIREAIKLGHIEDAASMLGRPFSLYGTVIKGEQLGRKLGFPTLNLKTEDECMPPHGVYQGHALLESKEKVPAAINIGGRPTVSSPTPELHIEAHLINFNGDLYSQEVELTFEQFIRSEQKFKSIEDLKEQIQRDVDKITRSLF